MSPLRSSALERRPFGRTGRSVSALGLGTWAMGGDEWGPADDRRSLDVLRAAVEGGITLIDTADVYGLGHAEELVGQAIREGSEPMIVTKVGWDIVTEPRVVGGSRRRYDREYLERAVTDSLARLRRSTVDVLLLHNPTRADLADGEAVRTLRGIRERGQATWIGASVGSEDDAIAAVEHGVNVLEVPFNIIRTWAVNIGPRAAAEGIAVIAREPFERGLLTGKYRPETTFPEGDHRTGKGRAWIEAGMPALDRTRSVADRLGVEPAAVALAYPLAHPWVSTVIAGARSVEQLDANISNAATTLSREDIQALEQDA